MIISAKFASTCPTCGRAIAIGSRVEWARGAKAVHVACPARPGASAGARAPRQAPRQARSSRRAPAAGESVVSRTSGGRGDGYEVGSTIHLPRVDGGSGDGHWFTVLAAWLDAPNEDMGSYDWTRSAIVRPATDPERVPAASALAEAQRKAALAAVPRWLAQTVRDTKHHTGGQVPGDAWRLSVGSRLAGSETLYVAEDAVWYVVSSYDDGPHVWRMPVSPAAATALAQAIEVLASGAEAAAPRAEAAS